MNNIKQYLPAYCLTFTVLMVIWTIFSGLLDLYHLSLGAISSAFVSAISARIIFPEPLNFSIFATWIHFFFYFPWLIWQIFMSSIHVLKLVLHPKMMEKIDPVIFDFTSRIKNDIGLITFANSITLTPGTITVRLTVFGKYKIHAIDKDSASGLPGDMEKRVAKIFNEKI